MMSFRGILSFILVFLSTGLYAQRLHTVSGSFTYYLSQDISVDQAKRQAVEKAKIQLIADEYQFCFWGVVCLRDLSECNKYPGTHNAEKPNGMLSIIFHAGTFNARIRRNLRYIFEIRTPIKYM